jgi:glyoxalase/bleomycin resistance protein/dioxygenase superfamily protein
LDSFQEHHREEQPAMTVKSITPVLFVEEIEPVVPFWVDKLGFTKAIEVPHGNKLGFVALQRDSTEVMYQTYASLAGDLPLRAETRKGPTFLYIQVDNLDAVLTALKGAKVVQPERTAYYGMREVGYQEPGGHFVTFAQSVAAAQH